MTAVVGAAHEAGVERLLDSYRAIPPGERVRLAKRTSNLFRPRAASTVPGLDVSGLDGVVEVDAEAPHRRRAGHVHLRAPGRRHAAARADAARRAAAAGPSPSAARSPGSASSRRRSATGCRTSRCSRWTSSPVTGEVVTDGRRTASTPTCSAASPTPTARSATPSGCASSSSRSARTSRCGTCGSTTSTSCVAALAVGGPRRRPSTASRSTSSTASCSAADRVLPRARCAQRRGRGRRATTPAATSTTARSSTTARDPARPAHHADYLWRWDTDWFWCSRAFGAQNPEVRRLWPKRLAAQQRLLEARRPRPPLRRRRPARGAPGPAAARAGGPGRRGPAGRDRRVPRLVPARGAHRAGLAVPAAAARATQPWALYPLHPGETYVNVGFWSSVPSDPAAEPTAPQPAHRARGHRAAAATSPCTPTSYYDEEEFCRALRRRRRTPR